MKRALLIADSPGWAYDIEAQSIKRHSNSMGWDADIDYVRNLRRKNSTTDLSEYDAVFWLFWYHAISLGPRLQGFDFRKSAVLVSSHVGWQKRGISKSELKKILSSFPGVGASSQKLLEEIDIEGSIQIPHGVDRSRFRFRRMRKSSILTLMWVGNPEIGHHGDLKGFNSIIRPVVSELDSTKVKLISATPENLVPYEMMPDFYSRGDILLVTSESEGNPMPVIESMHTGRPVISTDVGVVPELVRNGKNGWIIERNRSSLQNAIEEAMKSRTRLAMMGISAKKSVWNRTSKKKAKAVFKLLDRCVEE